MDATLVKSGETRININISRSHLGLTLTVSAVPFIEEMIRGMGNGEILPVKGAGRHWVPLEPKELLYYQLAGPLGPVRGDPGYFRLDRVGMPLIEPHPDRPSDVLNMSMLRLVGIGEGPGVRFGVRGVYTLEGCRNIATSLQQAIREFYVAYLKPVNISVIVTTQEFTP